MKSYSRSTWVTAGCLIKLLKMILETLSFDDIVSELGAMKALRARF